MSESIWACRQHTFRISHRPLILGIVNITPDSFSDGGRYYDPAVAVKQALELAARGADILDLGGESTRPNATPVPSEEEIDRVVPVVKELIRQSAVPLSIDTMKPEVARACLEAGASIINDVSGFRHSEMIDAAKEFQAGCIVMHMPGDPTTMINLAQYDDVVRELGDYFEERIATLTAAGIARESISLDPGIGFGKSTIHNFQLLAHLKEFTRFGRPICLGVSRKGLIERVTGRGIGERDPGSLAIACFAVAQGAAQILRVHDVGPARDAALLWEAQSRQVT